MDDYLNQLMKTTAQQNSELFFICQKSIEVIDDIVENENSKRNKIC
jgi:hypothetical protein